MVWNYQHFGTQSYRVNIDMGQLTWNLRDKRLRQRMYRIDDKLINYWDNPATAKLQRCRIPRSSGAALTACRSISSRMLCS
jgi:hypothetical protein